jgi:hypothetical protein
VAPPGVLGSCWADESLTALNQTGSLHRTDCRTDPAGRCYDRFQLLPSGRGFPTEDPLSGQYADRPLWDVFLTTAIALPCNHSGGRRCPRRCESWIAPPAAVAARTFVYAGSGCSLTGRKQRRGLDVLVRGMKRGTLMGRCTVLASPFTPITWGRRLTRNAVAASVLGKRHDHFLAGSIGWRA